MNTDQIIAAATVVNALVLIAAASFAWVQVKAARESTEAQMRPWVVVDLDALTRPPLMFLYVENIGRTVARDVSITFDPPLRSTFDDDERKFAELPLFSRLIPTLPPQKKIETLLDSAIQRLQTDLESSYEATVRYTGQVPGQKPKTYTETHVST
jgi:hypothetical protein